MDVTEMARLALCGDKLDKVHTLLEELEVNFMSMVYAGLNRRKLEFAHLEEKCHKCIREAIKISEKPNLQTPHT
jgi:hypothetical protein